MKKNDIDRYCNEYNINISQYRRSVGIALFNQNKKIFVGERIGVANSTLQMPQGGIDEGETIEEAARRELKEEIGTDKIKIIYKASRLHHYDFPDYLQYDGQRYIGQIQQWVLAQFLGRDTEIDIACEDPEFSHWQWMGIEKIVDSVVEFKKHIYRSIVEEFTPILSNYEISLSNRSYIYYI